MEEWRSVVGFEGLYQVSSEGRVRRIIKLRKNTPEFLKPVHESNGYIDFSPSRPGETRRTLRIHIAVTAAFLGPRPPRYTVNHRDGDKTNNRLENLEYVTYGQNNAHAYATGLKEGAPRGQRLHPSAYANLPKGERHQNSKLTDEAVRAIRASAESQYVLAERYGVDQAAVWRARVGKTWRHIH